MPSLNEFSNEFLSENDALDYIFQSFNRVSVHQRGLDEHTRDLTPTRVLLQREGLLINRREYALVTGSKGKGSVTALTANILKHLGHTVGMVTSPHLRSYRERIRVNGRAMPLADFLRILGDLAPSIDAVIATLADQAYLSPTGIFLAVALRWFDEQGVTVAVVEIGRGGRYDDNVLVPNTLAMFAPIVMEHMRFLGATVERIAWHKAGIIKPHSYAYSLPQMPSVLEVLRREAEGQDAQFEWIAPMDIGALKATNDAGLLMHLGRYGDIQLPFFGRYEIDNATLAVWGAGNIHARLNGVSHGSPDYIEGVRRGLETVIWHGRGQRIQTQPDVYIDGGINPLSVQNMVVSLKDRLKSPTIGVTAIPLERDFAGVLRALIPVCDTLIFTQTQRNVTLRYLAASEMLALGREIAAEVGKPALEIVYLPTVAEALDVAHQKAGTDGAIMMQLAIPAIGDALAYYGIDCEQI